MFCCLTEKLILVLILKLCYRTKGYNSHFASRSSQSHKVGRDAKTNAGKNGRNGNLKNRNTHKLRYYQIFKDILLKMKSQICCYFLCFKKT